MVVVEYFIVLLVIDRAFDSSDHAAEGNARVANLKSERRLDRYLTGRGTLLSATENKPENGVP